jgi:adenylate cyclase
VKQVGRELGVRYALEGSVRKSGNRVRVTAQLIEAGTGGHLWAERYDRNLADIFAVQDEITVGVSTAILPAMERHERERAARKPPDSLDAWECYHRGLWHYSKAEAAENATAIGFFERAIALDPCFSAAHAGLARALGARAPRFAPFAERPALISRALDHARLSIALDPGSAIAHGALAYALLLSGRHDEALAEADLAVSLDPNSTLALGCQAATRAFGGRPREAIAPLETAMRLSPFDPLKPDWLHYLSRAQYMMGNYRAAVATARQLCQSYPNFRPAYFALIAGLGQIGEPAEALRQAAEAIERFGEEFGARISQAHCHYFADAPENRIEDVEHLIDGFRKAGMPEE